MGVSLFKYISSVSICPDKDAPSSIDSSTHSTGVAITMFVGLDSPPDG